MGDAGRARRGRSDTRARRGARGAHRRPAGRRTDVPPNMYWYGSGFFTLQRAITWHTLGDARFAERAAGELTNGLRELPDAERDSEWAAFFTVAATEALTTAGEAECAVAQARQALAACRATKSTRLARLLHRAHTRMRDRAGRSATEGAPCPDMSRTVTTLSAWVTNWASVNVLPTGPHPRPFRSQMDASSTAPTSSTWASRARGYGGVAWSGASTRGTQYTVTSKFSTSVDGISLY